MKKEVKIFQWIMAILIIVGALLIFIAIDNVYWVFCLVLGSIMIFLGGLGSMINYFTHIKLKYFSDIKYSEQSKNIRTKERCETSEYYYPPNPDPH